MEYQGLTEDDLANVRELNLAWLQLPGSRTPVPLTSQRRERLANTPFLLFSLRPADEILWRRLLADECQDDLFRDDKPVSVARRDLQAAALAFLWALTRSNPYVARLVTGAPYRWCEQIASRTLLQVQGCARAPGLAEPLLSGESPLYRRLFIHGSSAVREKRDAAQLAVLQALLTACPGARQGRLPAAACRTKAPHRHIARKL